MSPLERAKSHYVILRNQLISEYPELAEDDVCLGDTLEGATDLHEQLFRVLRQVKLLEAEADGVRTYINQLNARAARKDKAATSMRRLVANVMQELGITKLDAPDMTVRLSAGKSRAIVTDAAAVPDDLCKIERTPLLTEIAAKLKAGESVAGCELSNGEPTLTVRVS